MIVRNIDGIIKIINSPSEQDDEFLAKNPTGGFLKVDILPFSRYGNYKMVGSEIVVDEDAEALELAIQYRHDRQYPSVEDQLDMIFHAGLGGDEFQAAIQAVKDAYPKPTE